MSELGESQVQRSALNWDFSIRLAEDIDAIHPYPAKFIPEIPATLLDEFPRPEGIILDPFSGSGTTLVQAQKRGLQSAGVDLNPIACLIARVKTSPIPVGAEAAIERVVNQARKAAAEIPAIPRLDHWFEPVVQKEVAALLHAIDLCEVDARDMLRLALSSILVRVSNQESDTRYAAVLKSRKPGDTYEAFASAGARVLKALSKRNYALVKSDIYEASTLKFDFRRLGKPVAAVITSPPYPNAYEYWLYHKYRMYWLGYDPQLVKAEEIGARAHFFKTNRHTANHFVEQMRTTLASVSQVLDPKGYAAFVVGRSKIHGEIVDNAGIIEDVGADLGFRVEYRAERNIAATRKSFNLAHANIKTETVLVLTR
jgi:DNA modification methylase